MIITSILLSRHGETLENRQDIMQGHMPGNLSEKGIQQAQELAQEVVKEDLDIIVSSDLKRSYDTAVIVNQVKNLPLYPTPLLREIDWGKHTGEKFSALDWNNLPDDSETLEDLLTRAEKFIQWVKENFSGKKILIIGHGAINRAITTFLEGKNVTEMLQIPIMENTAIIRYNI
ncbi:MAG: histidine phosphatase family protein [Odoribacter sp.]|nr:histidine phosphatase family protein [Odoribacter sp.]